MSAAPAPADRGELCVDIGERRVCWRGGRAELVPRPLPDGARPPEGFRCAGVGRARRCEERLHDGSSFVCDARGCLQERPRLPDDGEWECVDMAGVVFCRGRGEAAGIARAERALGWLCGARRGGSPGEEVCVDLDPDRPNLAGTFACSFVYQLGVARRICRASERADVGARCAARSECPAHTDCVAGCCLPARPAPACWLDADCAGAGPCAYGSCRSEGA